MPTHLPPGCSDPSDPMSGRHRYARRNLASRGTRSTAVASSPVCSAGDTAASARRATKSPTEATNGARRLSPTFVHLY